MDKSQEAKFTSLIEGVAAATGQTTLYDEVLALLKESSELSQKLSQTYDVKDEALQSLSEEYSIREVEISLLRNEAKLRKEVKEICDDLTSIKNAAEMQWRRMEDRIKTEEPTVGNIQRIVAEKVGTSTSPVSNELPTNYEFTPDQLAKVDELTKLPPDEFIKEMDEALVASNTLLNEGTRIIGKGLVDQIAAIRTLYQSRIATADIMILILRRLFKKYTFERYILRIKQEAIHAFLVIVILCLGVTYLISFFPWLLISLLLTGITGVLAEYFIQPYWKKRLFTPGKRKDLKLLLSEFYDKSILARCFLALAKHYVETTLFKDDPSLGDQKRG